MIDQINDAVKTSKGNVVVVEKGMKLTYDIAPAARLIDLDAVSYTHLDVYKRQVFAIMLHAGQQEVAMKSSFPGTSSRKSWASSTVHLSLIHI